MKRFIMTVIMLFLFVVPVNALTLAWDAYSDPEASVLRIYGGASESGSWAIVVGDIPTTYEASQLPDNPNDNERVYYTIRAYDSVNDLESANSNIVSFYWTTGGGGSEGAAAVSGIRFLNCNPYDAMPDDGSPEWAICDGRYNKQ